MFSALFSIFCMDSSFLSLLSIIFQSRSLFVKNLNFKTSDEKLKMHFSEHMKEGRILSVKVISDLFLMIIYDFLDTIIHSFYGSVPSITDKEALEKWKECFYGFWFYRI